MTFPPELARQQLRRREIDRLLSSADIVTLDSSGNLGLQVQIARAAQHRGKRIVVEVLETKFKHSQKLLAREKEYIRKCTVRVVPRIKLDVVQDDPDDNRIVECAVHSRSEAIVTNDNDLLRMKEYNGIRIVKVLDFLREGPERGR